MSRPSNPFPLPDALARDLAGVHAVWLGLRRAENDMPFADDLEASGARRAGGRRCCSSTCSTSPSASASACSAATCLLAQDKALSGKFIDEIELAAPLGFLRAQASATVEARAPTYYRDADGTARLLMPMWGDGRISLLLGAVHAVR